MLKKHIHNKRPSMTRAAKDASLMVLDTTEEDYNHFFHKWLYTYGGATDVVSLEDFIKEYDPDLYGDIDTYSNKVCPCVMCFEENIDG